MSPAKHKILLLLEDDLLKRVDDFRFENRINSRSEALRQLIEKGLDSSSPKKKPRGKGQLSIWDKKK